MNKGFSANATLRMFTIPARIVGQSPDPDGHIEWLVRGLTKDKILNGPGCPQPAPKFPGNVIVKSTPTMWKGVSATRDIPRDGVIFSERPLLDISRGMAPKSMMDPKNEYSLADYMKMMMLELEKQLEALVERMEPENRAKLMALTNCHSRDGN